MVSEFCTGVVACGWSTILPVFVLGVARVVSSRSTRAFARAVAKEFVWGLPLEVFARAVNNWFACLSSLEVGVLQSAVNISWVGGPLDIVCNGA